MAIYFNDKLLRPNKDGNDMEKMYHEGLERVSKLFKNGTIVLIRDGVTKKWDSEHASTRPIAAMSIPEETPMYIESIGATTVRYSEYPPQRNGKQLKFPLARLLVQEMYVIPESKKDLAWYIIEATSFVKSGILRIDDPQKEIIGKASAVKRIAKVDGLLLNENSPIYNREAILFLADKFGVVVPKNYDVESMAYLLREAVLAADKVANHPNLDVDRFLKAASKIAKVEAKDDEFELKDSYTREELEGLHYTKLNSISGELGLPKPPKCKKAEQIDMILEQQSQPVE